MLFISIPKSAGTSLVHTIGKILEIPIVTGIRGSIYDIDCEGFTEIQKYYSTMTERTSLFVDEITKSKTTIYRDHLLPTGRHLSILKKINRKYVILLRKPSEIIDSHKRLKKSNIIDFNRLSIDVEMFYNNYLLFSKVYDKCLIVLYKDLILDYNKTMDKIFDFWELKKPNKYMDLLKIHYTGVGDKRLKEGIKCC